jgi:hypothetical protein
MVKKARLAFEVSLLALVVLVAVGGGVTAMTRVAPELIYWGAPTAYADMYLPPHPICEGGQLANDPTSTFSLPGETGVFFVYPCPPGQRTIVRYFSTDVRYPALHGAGIPPRTPAGQTGPSPQPPVCPVGFVVARSGSGCVPPNHPLAQ